MKAWIPNALTLINLLCGVFILWIGMMYELKGWYSDTSYIFILSLLVLATLCDFLDGFLARKLKVESPLGKELDSLADMISFGVVPFFLLILYFFNVRTDFFELIFGCFLLPILGSAYRLALFNITPQMRGFFYGLPTPANAYLHFSLYVGLHRQFSIEFWKSPYGILLIFIWCIGITILLVTRRVKFLALKGGSMSFVRKKALFFLALTSLMFVWLFHWFAGIFILFLYYFVSQWVYRREKNENFVI